MTDRKHSHYFRPFPYDNIDIYRFLEVFDVTCPVAQHIIKKAVASGQRGHKDLQRDWQDIVDSAQRKLEMLRENDLAWWGCSEEELGKLALENDQHIPVGSGCPAFDDDDTSFSLKPNNEPPWYPSDIPDLEWKETNWKEPMFDQPKPEVYVLFRVDRETQCWDKEYGTISSYDWRNDQNDFDIVAYAVKPEEKQTQYDFPTGVVPR